MKSERDKDIPVNNNNKERKKRERERIVLHEKRKSCLLTVPLK